ncbi:MAG: hypothetical protein GXP17_01905 [Gammaproteobacteria bacterium]|nr:hypothetical protein [Gammaproteobacteria bacterium]
MKHVTLFKFSFMPLNKAHLRGVGWALPTIETRIKAQLVGNAHPTKTDLRWIFPPTTRSTTP